MIGWGIAAAVLILIAILPVGAAAELHSEGYWIRLAAGPFWIPILPQQKKENKEKGERKKKPVPSDSAGGMREKHVRGGSLDFVLELIRAGIEALGRFRRRLVVRKMIVHFTAAASDPSTAALMFGGGCAGCGTLTALLYRYFRIRKMDLSSDIDFSISSPIVYLYADIRIPIWAIVGIGARFGVRFLKAAAKRPTGRNNAIQRERGKVETFNG